MATDFEAAVGRGLLPGPPGGPATFGSRMTLATEAMVQSWAMVATALSLLGILAGAGAGWRFGFSPGLVVGLLAFAAPWAVAAARATLAGAGVVALAIGGFAIVPAAAAAVVGASHWDERRRASGATKAAPLKAAPLLIRVASALFLLSFGSMPLSDWLGLGAAESAGWTFIAIGGATVTLAVAFAATRSGAFGWVTALMTALCLGYFGLLALGLGG